MIKRITILQIVLIWTFNTIFGQKINADSLENVIATSTDTTKLYAIKSYLADYYYKNPKQCRKYQPIALKIALKHKDLHSEAFVYNNIAITYAIKSELDSSEKYFRLAVELERNTKNKKNLDNYLPNYGYVFKTRGDYKKATTIYFEALKISESQNDNLGIGLNLYNIANVYFLTEDYEKSKQYFQKSLNAYKKKGRQINMAQIYSAFGSIYENTDSLHKAIEMYNKAMKIYLHENANFQIPLLHHNIASVYFKLGKFDKTITHAKKSLDFFDKINTKEAKLDPLFDLIKAFIELKKYKESKKYFLQASELLKSSNDLDLKEKYYQSAIILAKYENDFKKAFEYSENLSIIKDSLFNIKQDKVIGELTTKYETEKKERKIQVLELDNVKKKATILRLVMFGSLIILIFIIIIILLRQIAKKREQELFIKIQEQEKKRSFELFHNTGNKLKSLSAINPEELSKMGDTLRGYSHLLYIPDFKAIEITEAITELVVDYEKFKKFKIRFKNYIPIRISNKISKSKLYVIFSIVQELLQNALKHSDASQVFLDIHKEKNKITIQYQDNGKGAEPNENSGKGIKHIKQYIKMFKGDIEITTKPNKGYRCSLSIVA